MKDAILDVVGYFIPSSRVEFWNEVLEKAKEVAKLFVSLLGFLAILAVGYLLSVMLFVTFG